MCGFQLLLSCVKTSGSFCATLSKHLFTKDLARIMAFNCDSSFLRLSFFIFMSPIVLHKFAAQFCVVTSSVLDLWGA